MIQQKVHFKGLDTLRAIGAFSVLIGHIELSKKSIQLPNIFDSVPFFKNTSGHLGVILFFVLSGFLITFLLLQEKENTSTISLKKFYIRRALRIMPIYYLVVILLLFVFPFVINFDYFGKPNITEFSSLLPTFLIYFFLMPNLMVFGISGIGGGFHLGTIGTEEQFYIIWPVIILKFKNIVYPLLFIFFFIMFMPNAVDYLKHNYFSEGGDTTVLLERTSEFFMHFKINCMALGGLFAYVFYFKKKIIKILYHNITQIIFFSLGFGGWIFGLNLNYFSDEFYALCFAIIILNVATNPKRLFSLESRITNYFGRISYGIYIYHWIIIYLIMDKLAFMSSNQVAFNLILYIGVIGLTLLISHFSYYYFEKGFLKLKDQNRVV